VLVFLPGFMAPASAYDALLRPLRQEHIEVTVLQWYGPVAGLSGKYTAVDEANDTTNWVRAEIAEQPDDPIWLAGHSRGGQAAWRAALDLGKSIAGLITVDPVDGAGPRPRSKLITAQPANLAMPTLIIGAGISSSCAPAGVNHDAFAAACPAATHVVIEDMGHADVMSGAALQWGRRLCRGGTDPDQSRAEVSRLMVQWITGDGKTD
jgi:pimeloyl-ACP methyl ester carboxylesterase